MLTAADGEKQLICTEMQENMWARLRELCAPGCESCNLAHVYSCIYVCSKWAISTLIRAGESHVNNSAVYS